MVKSEKKQFEKYNSGHLFEVTIMVLALVLCHPETLQITSNLTVLQGRAS